MESYRTKTPELIKDRDDGMTYMIVGFEIAVDVSVSRKQAKSSTMTVLATALVDKIVQGVSHGAVDPSDAMIPEFRHQHGNGSLRETSFCIVGKQISAIRYHTLRLNQGHFGKADDVKYGEIKLYRKQSGVYANFGEEPQIGEYGFDNGGEFDEVDIERSNESIQSLAERLDFDIPVAKFDT